MPVQSCHSFDKKPFHSLYKEKIQIPCCAMWGYLGFCFCLFFQPYPCCTLLYLLFIFHLYQIAVVFWTYQAIICPGTFAFIALDSRIIITTICSVLIIYGAKCLLLYSQINFTTAIWRKWYYSQFTGKEAEA